MEITVSTRMPKEGEFVADISIKGMDVYSLASFHTEEIRDMIRPQVMFILRQRGADPSVLKECASAIVDGTPLSRSSSPKDKSDGQDSSDSNKPPRTKESN